jgi:hypothetical protein
MAGKKQTIPPPSREPAFCAGLAHRTGFPGLWNRQNTSALEQNEVVLIQNEVALVQLEVTLEQNEVALCIKNATFELKISLTEPFQCQSRRFP